MPMYEWGIENGTVWLPSGPVAGHLYGQGSQIDAISRRIRPAKNRWDVTGCEVLPGAIDAHVHSRDPGWPDKEDIVHSTAAAAMGGVTTILEMPNSLPPVRDIDTFRQRIEAFDGRSYVDFGLWSLWVPGMDESWLDSLIEAGTVGFKVFWGYALDAKTLSLVYDWHHYDQPVVNPPTVGDVLEFLEMLPDRGPVVAVHAEDATIIGQRQRHAKPGVAGYQQVLWEHPAIAEDSLIATLIELARVSQAPVHIVHLASANILNKIDQARSEGVNISVETAPHYLLWNATDIEVFEGWGKVFPPIREVEHQNRLVDGLRKGTIDMIASDHAPHHPREKAQGWGQARAGMASVQMGLLTLIHLAAQGWLPFERIPVLSSLAPAKRFGLWPHKGSLQVGADADMVIVDRRAVTYLDQEVLKTKHPQPPWLHQTLQGRIQYVFLRGRPLVQQGDFENGIPARGQFIRPVWS